MTSEDCASSFDYCIIYDDAVSMRWDGRPREQILASQGRRFIAGGVKGCNLISMSFCFGNVSREALAWRTQLNLEE